MIECPVCRSLILGTPGDCSNCGTPLRKEDYFWLPFILNCLLPGVGHFLVGYLLWGGLVTFGSFFLGLTIRTYIWTPPVEWMNLFIAAGIWVGWVAVWIIHISYLRHRNLNVDSLLFYLGGLLLILNTSAFFYWLIMMF